MSWIRYHVNYLKMWRKAAEVIAKAAEEAGLRAEVYVVGEAAEGRLTVLSDVDVVIAVHGEPSADEAKGIRRLVLRLTIDHYGLPWDYPVEVHVMGYEEFKKAFIDRGKKVVRVGPA
ncbi:MAG: nucleotidyltransferase domain-containing protein [Desulfurococcaceae archaeon]